MPEASTVRFEQGSRVVPGDAEKPADSVRFARFERATPFLSREDRERIVNDAYTYWELATFYNSPRDLANLLEIPHNQALRLAKWALEQFKDEQTQGRSGDINISGNSRVSYGRDMRPGDMYEQGQTFSRKGTVNSIRIEAGANVDQVAIGTNIVQKMKRPDHFSGQPQIQIAVGSNIEQNGVKISDIPERERVIFNGDYESGGLYDADGKYVFIDGTFYGDIMDAKGIIVGHEGKFVGRAASGINVIVYGGGFAAPERSKKHAPINI